MSGETSAIAEIANKVSKDIFKWFKWERVTLKDQNFDCLKQKKHAPTKTRPHTHPVDIVFKYDDPYLEQSVLLNTDLKSYSSASISAAIIRKSIKSLAQTVDCARVSNEWRDRYDVSGNGEIRGLLFVYNHDGEYDQSFMGNLQPSGKKGDDEDEKGVNLNSLPLESGQLIHIIEPATIAFLTTVIADVHRLNYEGTFPYKNYFFLYPELQLHRTRFDKYKRPATVELITGPFFVVGHDAVQKHDEVKNQTIVSYHDGYVVFYNRPGNSHYEFMYLFDVLSSYQILDRDKHIRIRVAHSSPNPNLIGLFKKAIEMYVADWNFDDYKREILEDIAIDIIEIHKTSFSSVDIGWER